MTSQINPYNINGNYPIAGQDNDSQGFRDNFTNLRNNLVFAKSEIEDLQNKVVLKRPLAGGSVNDASYNEMDGTKLSNVQLKGWSQTTAYNGDSGATRTLDPSQGNFYKLSLDQDCTVTLNGFPLGTGAGWGQLILWLESPVAGRTLTFTNSVNGIERIAGFDGEDTITFEEANVPYLFLIGSFNDNDYYIVDLSRNAVEAASVVAPSAAEPAPATGMIAFANGDGTDGWDPAGTDAGVPYPVYYDGSNWVTFGGAGGSTAWASITGKPTFATVATSGDYADLSNPPTIPADINDLAYSDEDVADSAAVDLTVVASYFTTAGAETATLAAGTNGQVKVLAAVDVAAGNMVVTVTNAAWGGSGTITFAEQGQTANLMYINGKWFCIGAGPGVSGTQPSFD